MSNFDKAIKIIMAEPPEPHYPAYYADLLSKADVPDKDARNCSEIPNNSDTISRQAAIDIVDDLRDCISVDGYWAWMERLKKLPSAQPVIRTQMSSANCISRQAVIDALYDWSNHTMTDAEAWHLRQVIGDIKSMPSIQPDFDTDQKINKAYDDGYDQGYLQCKTDQEVNKMEKANATFGTRISDLLDQQGLSQRELADKVGVTEVSMSRYIKGERTPKGPIIANIAKVLHTTSDFLLGLETGEIDIDDAAGDVGDIRRVTGWEI